MKLADLRDTGANVVLLQLYDNTLLFTTSCPVVIYIL